MALVDDFKGALSCWASGVSVVSTIDDGLTYGLTVSSLASVSLEPPLVVVCIGLQNRLCAMVEHSQVFGVSILARDQEAVSNHFAMPGREPAADLPYADGLTGPGGVPLIRHAAATLSCELHHSTHMGDHVMHVGRVVAAAGEPDSAPLLYFRRAYRGVEL